MGTKSTYELYDRILGGRLGDLLSEWRDEVPRPSFETMARRLVAHDVDVTGETVRRWTKELGIGTDEPEAATA